MAPLHQHAVILVALLFAPTCTGSFEPTCTAVFTPQELTAGVTNGASSTSTNPQRFCIDSGAPDPKCAPLYFSSHLYVLFFVEYCAFCRFYAAPAVVLARSVRGVSRALCASLPLQLSFLAVNASTHSVPHRPKQFLCQTCG